MMSSEQPRWKAIAEQGLWKVDILQPISVQIQQSNMRCFFPGWVQLRNTFLSVILTDKISKLTVSYTLP